MVCSIRNQCKALFFPYVWLRNTLFYQCKDLFQFWVLCYLKRQSPAAYLSDEWCSVEKQNETKPFCRMRLNNCEFQLTAFFLCPVMCRSEIHEDEFDSLQLLKSWFFSPAVQTFRITPPPPHLMSRLLLISKQNNKRMRWVSINSWSLCKFSKKTLQS